MASKMFEKFNDLADFYETRYKGIFRIAEYKFEVQIKKFKIADPKWRLEFAIQCLFCFL